MKTCGYCGRENQDELRYCKECGTEIVEVPAAASEETKDRKPWPDLGLRYAGYTFVAVLLYLLSCGPITYCFSKVASTNTKSGLMFTRTVTVTHPMWVGVLYYPAFFLEQTAAGNQTYGRYLEWWRERALRRNVSGASPENSAPF